MEFGPVALCAHWLLSFSSLVFSSLLFIRSKNLAPTLPVRDLHNIFIFYFWWLWNLLRDCGGKNTFADVNTLESHKLARRRWIAATFKSVSGCWWDSSGISVPHLRKLSFDSHTSPTDWHCSEEWSPSERKKKRPLVFSLAFCLANLHFAKKNVVWASKIPLCVTFFVGNINM